MAKEYKTQKKKTALTTLLDILFKALVGIAVIIFAYIAYTNVSFSTPKMQLTTHKTKNKENNSHVPSELRWFNSFKGIENVPDKKAKEKPSANGGSGFKYEGFNK